MKTAWFNIMLCVGKRGCENQRNMVKEDVQFQKSTSRIHHAHCARINSNKTEVLAVMAENPTHGQYQVLALKKYLSKRNGNCQALWQKPRDRTVSKFRELDEVWFRNTSLGKHSLSNPVTQMSKEAGLSTIYTPHCISHHPQGIWTGKYKCQVCYRSQARLRNREQPQPTNPCTTGSVFLCNESVCCWLQCPM